jgi:hypothetical protein
MLSINIQIPNKPQCCKLPNSPAEIWKLFGIAPRPEMAYFARIVRE